VTAGAIRRAKLQSYCHLQQTDTQLFTGRMPFLSPNQQCQKLKGNNDRTSCVGGRHNMPPQVDLLTLKVVSESCVTWTASVPILVFLDLSVLDLGPMSARDRQTSNTHHCLMPPTLGVGHNNHFS